MATTVTHLRDTARTVEALALAEVLRALGIDAAGAGELSELGWLLAASLAGLQPPSEQARESAIWILSDANREPDPFAAFDRDKARR